MLDRADWRLRSPEFGQVWPYDDGRAIVVMELEPLERDRLAEWMWLQHLWLDLPAHPQLLDAVDRGIAGKLLLRYAALDWQRETPWVDRTSATRRLIAAWGAQVTSCFLHVANHVPPDERHHFARPFVRIDLVNNARVGFLPVARDDRHLPPEARAAWPACSEQTLMFVIGGVVRDCALGWDAKDARPVGDILRRCLHPDPSQRYENLSTLAAAWRKLALPDLAGSRQSAWDAAEEGVGWLAVGRPHSALHAFRTALDYNPRLQMAKEGRDRIVIDDRAAARAPLQMPRPAKPRSEVVEDGALLEEGGAHREAISLYKTARSAADTELDTAIARCQLALDVPTEAVDFAKRALSVDPVRAEALSICTRAELRLRRFADALQTADRWLAVDSADGVAHYARGRALLALGRVVEARDAFDRACTLRPQMLEAMLLRREADRASKRAKANAGEAKPMTVEVPAHLAALQDALVSGRADEAIAVLEGSAYDGDAVAKLVHAECLAFARRFEEAIAMFDRAAALAPDQAAKALIGKVHALLALERATEAIAELDRAQGLDEVERAQLRGLALERLGSSDAEPELRRATAVAVARSDLRLGR